MSAGLKMALTGVGVAIFIAVGIFLMMQFAASERDREMRQWQSRMSIVIDSRYTDINRWIDRQLADLRGIADNASVQLYLTVFHESGTSASADDAPPELGYLGNLLEVVGERAGFKSEVQGPQVNANVQKAGVAGLALIDMDNFIIVSSSGFPRCKGRFGRFWNKQNEG